MRAPMRAPMWPCGHAGSNAPLLPHVASSAPATTAGRERRLHSRGPRAGLVPRATDPGCRGYTGTGSEPVRRFVSAGPAGRYASGSYRVRAAVPRGPRGRHRRPPRIRPTRDRPARFPARVSWRCAYAGQRARRRRRAAPGSRGPVFSVAWRVRAWAGPACRIRRAEKRTGPGREPGEARPARRGGKLLCGRWPAVSDSPVIRD